MTDHTMPEEQNSNVLRNEDGSSIENSTAEQIAHELGISVDDAKRKTGIEDGRNSSADGCLTVDEDGDITVAVAYPGRDDLDLPAQIRAGAGALWQEMQVEPDGLSAVFGPVEAGDYQVRARWVGPQNVAGDWSSPLSEITVS